MPKYVKSLFRTSAVLSGLLTNEQVNEALLQAVSAGGPAVLSEVSDDLLAELLIAQTLLTPYQVAQLKAGRTKLNLGPYVITDWIGQGGMGQVFKAIHNVLGRECAVKILPVNRSTPDAIANFSREIRMQAKLDHPNLVRAYDAGNDGKVPYLVVEFIPGCDLRRLVRLQGPLLMQQAASVIMQAALGLEYAHHHGLIHRDVKPGNILVTPDGIAKVSDLGLAGFALKPDEDPRAGKIVGTPDYLSPEQIRTPKEVRGTADIYSLGCTLYYAITGKVPFPGGTTADKTRRHCEETPWHPRRFNTEVSEEFVDVIADMMHKDASARTQSAGEVAARLEVWAGEAGPIASRSWSKAAWLPPPVPAAGNGSDDNQETEVVDHEQDPEGRREQESPSQGSQGTDPVVTAEQETMKVKPSQRNSAPPPPGSEPQAQPLNSVRFELALAAAVTVSMFLGVLIGFVLRGLLR